MERWKGNAFATLISSMPHKDRDKAIELVLRSAPEVPAWPQLAAYLPEQMMVQYNEGLPGLRSSEGRVFVQTDSADFDQELYSFYEEYLAVEAGEKKVGESAFAMGPETAASLDRFIHALEGAGLPLLAVKGQIAGPFTLLSGLKDQDGRALLFDERFQDVVPKLLGIKARWQAEKLAAFGVPVIVFMDEPALAGFGSSAFISIGRELVHQLLTEVAAAIRGAGALAGIHICANTDWLLAFDAGLDVINFDAYNHMDRFALYREACSAFWEAGGTVAWGIVPTNDTEALLRETPEALAQRLLEGMGLFVSDRMPLSRIIGQSLITPSCGCGSLSEELTERVLFLTAEVSRIVRQSLR